jgi:hypothetical protein
MLRISGPELVAIMQLHNKNNQVIYLFGDEHYDTVGKCTKCTKKNNCVSITRFLRNILGKETDVFIESPWVPEYYKKNYQKIKKDKNDDFLTDIKRTFHHKLYSHNHKPILNKNTRFHFTDIRNESHISVLGYVSYIYYFKSTREIDYAINIIHDFDNINMFIKYVNACVQSDDFIESINKLFEDNDVVAKRYIIKKSLVSNPENKEIKNKSIHRIRKQILKLPKNDQTILTLYHNHKMKLLVSESFSKEYSTNRQKVLNDPNLFSPYFARINHVIHHYLLHMMDMYHLARMLYYISTKPSNFVISYTGSAHTHNYIEFFTKFYKKHSSVLHLDDKSTQVDDLTNKKCVAIPQEYVP